MTAFRFTTKITIGDTVFTHHHDSVEDLKETLRTIDPRALNQISNIYVEENGRPLDGSETLVRLILA